MDLALFGYAVPAIRHKFDLLSEVMVVSAHSDRWCVARGVGWLADSMGRSHCLIFVAGVLVAGRPDQCSAWGDYFDGTARC